MAKQHNVPTTNFVIHLDRINQVALSQKYQLFTIEVPDSFRFSQDKNKFAKLHNTYKEKLDFPYYFFSFAEPKASIFVLVEKSEQPKEPISLSFDFLKGEKVIAQEKNITELCTKKNLPILAKLFLSSWYHKAHRTCQGDYFYIHSKDDKQKLTALLVKIQESKGEFEIKPEAKYLKSLDNKFNTQYLNLYNYFEQVQGTRYLRQLKQSEVENRLQNQQNLTTIFRETTTQDAKNLKFKPQRPAIKWYDSHKTDVNIFQGCRSELLRNFQNELIAYYNEVFGEDSTEKRTHFMTEIVPTQHTGNKGKGKDFVKGYAVNEKTGKSTGLFWKILDKIAVLDLRQKDINNPNKNNFQNYIDLLNKQYGNIGISFSEIQKEDLKINNKPILVLQDVEKQIFEEDGFLLGYDDTKKELYQKFAHKMSMQTLNINLNKADDFNSADTYFEYDTFKIEDYKHRLDVCLSELLLKKYIIDKLPIYNDVNLTHSLPCLFNFKSLRKDFAYMYQNVFMYVDNQYVLQFLNLDNPSEKETKNTLLQKLGIDLFNFDTNFSKCNYTENNEEKTLNKMKNTHFIFAKELVLAIEDTEERVLFDTGATQTSESQRIIESKTALEGICFSETDNIYTVGEKSMGMSMDKSIKVRRLHYYQKPDNFKIDDLLQTLSVEFVRNKQYTVYPYFFDLLNLYRKDIQQVGQDE
jgi:hypothetical protein